MANHVDGNLIGIEVNPILETNNPIAKGLSYSGVLHTPKLDIKLSMINSYDVLRDYNGNVGDYVLIDFSLISGTYVRDVAPYKDNLELTVTCEVKDEVNNKSKIEFEHRYKFVISNHTSDESDRTNIQDRETLNTTSFKRVVGQCLDRGLEAIRSCMSNGIFRDTTVENVILSELANVTANGIYVDGTTITPSVDIVKCDNIQQYNHIIVGTGRGSDVKILDLPSYLHNTKYGVYNGGIFTYYQIYNKKDYIFVGPSYNSMLYHTSKGKKLIIVRSNSILYDEVESTYLIDGDTIKILVKSDAKAIDNGENDFISDGDSYAVTNPMAIINRDLSISKNNVSTSTTNRLESVSIKDRRDKNNTTNYVGANVNLYKIRSKYVRATMAIFQVIWNNCDMDLIYPGMPVCYIYADSKNGVINLYGTVQSTYSRFNNELKTRSGLINIAVEKKLFGSNPEGDDRGEDQVEY